LNELKEGTEQGIPNYNRELPNFFQNGTTTDKTLGVGLLLGESRT